MTNPIDPRTLQDDERALMFCAYQCQLLINKGFADAGKAPVPSAKLMRNIKHAIEAYPELFQWDDTVLKIGMQTCQIRYGIVFHQEQLETTVRNALLDPINDTRN